MFSISACGVRSVLKYEAAGLSFVEPLAVRILRTNWSYGVLAASSPRIQLRSAVAPSRPRNLRLTINRSAHLLVQIFDVVVAADELVDERVALDFRIARIVDERLNLLRRRRQAGQVEIHAADEFVVVRKRRRQRLGPLELGGHQFVDAVIGRRILPHEAGAVAHHGERRGGVFAFVAHERGRFAAAQRFQQARLIGHRFHDIGVAAFDERFARDVALAAVGIGRHDAHLLPRADRFDDGIVGRDLDAR